MATLLDYLKRVAIYVGIGAGTTAVVVGGEPAISRTIQPELNSSTGIEQRLKETPKPPRKIRYRGGVAYAQGTGDYRGEFRRLGWDVYDAPELAGRPERIYEYKIMPEILVGSLNPTSGSIRDIFSEKELELIAGLTDGNHSNDELRGAFVTRDGYLSLTVLSPYKQVGKGGNYSLQKKLSPENANRLRRVSPDFRSEVLR